MSSLLVQNTCLVCYYRTRVLFATTEHVSSLILQNTCLVCCYKTRVWFTATEHVSSLLLQNTYPVCCYRTCVWFAATEHVSNWLLKNMCQIGCYRPCVWFAGTDHVSSWLLQTMCQVGCYRACVKLTATEHVSSWLLQRCETSSLFSCSRIAGWGGVGWEWYCYRVVFLAAKLHGLFAASKVGKGVAPQRTLAAANVHLAATEVDAAAVELWQCRRSVGTASHVSVPLPAPPGPVLLGTGVAWGGVGSV